MAWNNLPTDYTDASWEGDKKYVMTYNSDGTISLTDVTVYSNKEKSFFGAKDANQINEAINRLVTLDCDEAGPLDWTCNLYVNVDGELRKVNYDTLLTEIENDCVPNESGAHNAIYRGAHLGDEVSKEQWKQIKQGTFKDMYIGDYWTIEGMDWIIAAFDYYLGTGDVATIDHHVVIVPRTHLYTHHMNPTDTTNGAYVGSDMYLNGLVEAKSIIKDAFGSSHILWHPQYLHNAANNGITTAAAWFRSDVVLMTEQNVYGSKVYGNYLHGSNYANNGTVDKSQFPLFFFKPDYIGIGWYWLRDVANNNSFANVTTTGNVLYTPASTECGVRPSFCIYQED